MTDMATEGGGPDAGDDPAADGRANYDYRGEAVERPGLMADLDDRVDGDVRFDTYTRQLYATDASAYEMTPIGVVFPTSTADVSAAMAYCAEREIPVLPRGGGTSLAGQAVNEAVVLDFTRYMDGVVAVDPDRRVATAEPGVRLGDLNEALAAHDLKFAPDPAWGDKSALGGAIGNNSTGSHSLWYGKTDAYIEEVEVVLADGTVTTLGETPLDEIRSQADPDADAIRPRLYAQVVRVVDEEAAEVDRRYPDLKRNVSGYNLDQLVAEARAAQDPTEERETVNLARLVAGSEGTLAVVTGATVSLEPVPTTKAVALLTYDSLLDAMEDVEPILAHDPAAVEVMDDVLLDLARDTAEFADVVATLPEGTDSVLLVEFYAESDTRGRQLVADLVADRVPDAETAAAPSAGATTTDAERHAVHALEAHDAETRERFWKMRKAGLPILLGRTTDEKHVAFIEDTAVPAENLPAYVADFREVLDDHGTFACFYAHAGPGVLHIRPLIDTKTAAGVEQMESIAAAATDLVVEYGGSVSGEHGDGRARTQWNRKLYGDRLWGVFRDLKSAVDPDWLLNPGTVCGDHDMTENLRFGPDYAFDAGFDPELDWGDDSFQGMAELCHGCGGCRGAQSTTGGVMCPTYRASQEEIQSTRGRANLLRQAMSGDLSGDEQFDVEFMREVLSMCVGCKGCAVDCPSEVDMAKMKVEVEREYRQRHGASLRDRLFANVHRLWAAGSRFAPLSNLPAKIPGVRWLLEKTVGIASERPLPTFRRESLRDWFDARGGPRVDPDDAARRALLFPDTYTTYSDPGAGKAAVRALEAADVHVDIPEETVGSGRPPYSKGFVAKARTDAWRNVDALAPRVAEGWDVVVVEPSDAVMLQSDYGDLLSGDDVAAVAGNTYGVLEYFDAFGLDERLTFEAPDEHLTYHGHCHQKATKKDHHAVGVLRRAGYRVDPLDSTCCGMAGTFGYEAEHYSMSRAVGRILFDQVAASAGETAVAPGASCRTQLGDECGRVPHPVEKLVAAID
jgi:FAD/FMN-containing dehydrogenase/Fe-S oxidoreductase